MFTLLVALNDSGSEANAQVDAIEDLVSGGSDATVHLLHVFEDNPEGASIQQLEAVRTAQERLEPLGIDVRLLEASGDPAEEILDHAEEHDVDQICVGGRKRTPAGKALFGSVTQDVILGARRPVLVCGSDSNSE